MIIKKLILHNFGVYAGTNIFELHADKPIVLVGGLNGRGKTTFLEGVLLALYGKNSFAYSEDEELSYGRYLKSLTNTADGTFASYVDIQFYMNADGTEEYEIKRTWDGSKGRISEVVSVYKDGVYNQFLTDNWSMFMENVLPSVLSSFFFFDGEKIADLAVENSSNQMKESIKALLGITVLDRLENDIRRIISRTVKNCVNNEETSLIDQLRTEKDAAIEELDKIDRCIEESNEELLLIQKQIDKANEEYIAKGGDIVTQRQELINKRTDLRVKMSSVNEGLLIDSASELPLLLVIDLLRNIREKAEIEQDYRTMSVAVDKMKNVLPQYKKMILKNESNEIDEFLVFFKNLFNKIDAESEFGLSDTALSQLQLLLDQRLLDRKLKTINKKESLSELIKESDQIDSYLSVDIDENAIATIFKRIKKLEQERSEIESKIEVLQQKRKTANGNAISKSAEFNRKVEAYLKKVELNDDGDRILKYANVANTIIDRYRVALQKKKVTEVARTMTECYKLLANKKSLIEKIDMDPTTLDMKFINSEGKTVPRKRLSAGEKQLTVIALLWSLAICSKKRLPVIIDTPLSRLDSIHRQAVVTVYFPKASDQTIILSTDSEINREYYNMMKNNIGDEFTLVYDEESKSTSIKKGYFLEDSNDHKTN